MSNELLQVFVFLKPIPRTFLNYFSTTKLRYCPETIF